MSKGIGVLAALALMAVSQVAAADRFDEFWTNMKVGYHVNAMWPYPYVKCDRAAVHAPFQLMEANGWRRQNLMSAYYFSLDSSDLTEAGKLKLHWILTQTPINRRTIFVQRAVDRSETALRLLAVERAAKTMLGSDELADIQETNLNPPGRPAEEVDQNLVKYRENSPVPQLPAADASIDTGQ